jgi:hypothetical protein
LSTAARVIPGEERGKPGSDHAAVVATFQLPT